MIYQQLLRRAVAGRPRALVDFVETIAPHLLERFTTIPALGGSGRLPSLDPRLPEGLSRFTEQELSRFSERNPDQSLTAHILNGLFSGLRLAEWLPPEKALSDLEQRLWILGYIVHDYTKVYGIKVLAGQLEIIREVIRCLGDDLSFDAYLPNWRDYLDDVVFLAQNTQKVEGANLNLRDYQLKTQPRRLDLLRFLSSYADVLVHIKSPSDVMLPEASGRNTTENLRKTLDDLFGTGRAPRLTYHKLSEVRGLLSNLIHNAVMTQLKEQGYEPYLFFPSGVAYLADPAVEARVDLKRVAVTVWERILEIVGENETFGIRRAGTGFIPSTALYKLTGLTGVLGTGRRKAMGLTNSKSMARLYGFFTGESESDLKRRFGNDAEGMQEEQERLVEEQGLPFDIRVDRLGEFLTMVYRTVGEHFKGTPDTCSALLGILGLSGLVTPTEATRQEGGTYFGWFYAAASYIQAHPQLDNTGIEDVVQNISERVLAWVNEQGLKAKGGQGIDIAIKQYTIEQLEIDGQKIVAEGDHRVAFAQELGHYMMAKTMRKRSCSLCCSRFEATKQEDQEAPFGPQKYTNKHPLGWRQVKRGICPICRIELILRRIQQPGLDEERRPIQLYLYPTYFFTLETERVAKSFLVEMADLNVFALRQNLRKQSFSLGAFLRFEGFLGDGSGPRRGIRTPAYREYEPAGLVFGSLTPLGQKPTDTDAWIVPALLAIGISLLLDVKAVASSSFVPIFSSGADFRETAVLDGLHAFINRIWGRDRFRVDELEHSLHRLLNL
jgi:CRISPR-associated protein Csc3